MPLVDHQTLLPPARSARRILEYVGAFTANGLLTIGFTATPERQRLKRERAEGYRQQRRAEQPPTERQVSYSRSLGYHSEVMSRLHSSRLIDQLLAQKGARDGY
jgi:hypothetical protein